MVDTVKLELASFDNRMTCNASSAETLTLVVCVLVQMAQKTCPYAASGLQKLNINIEESAGSVLSTIRALKVIIGDRDNKSSRKPNHLEQALMKFVDHPRHPQDITGLLGMALDLQGLSPEAASRRTRLVTVLLRITGQRM